jgi:hypothetical protein
MAIITFDVTRFRALFPAFASVTKYPDSVLEIYWGMACEYISNDPSCNPVPLSVASRTFSLSLMTAHFAALNDQIASGQTPGQIQSSTIDKISVSLTPPPQKNQWQWWLGLTPYGQQLLALLQVKSAGGFYLGALPETAAFRRVGGIFI